MMSNLFLEKYNKKIIGILNGIHLDIFADVLKSDITVINMMIDIYLNEINQEVYRLLLLDIYAENPVYPKDMNEKYMSMINDIANERLDTIDRYIEDKMVHVFKE